MFRSLKLGSAFGIGVYIHWSFWLLPLIAVASSLFQDGPGPVFILALVMALVVCVVLHEFGHALMARCFGIRTRDITMYPIGGVARLEGMGERPIEEFLIAIAGPAVNVVLVVLLATLWVAGHFLQPDFGATDPGQFVKWLGGMNLALVLFNMIPAFPMDGGRVLRASLSAFLGPLRATRIAAGLAAPLALVMGAVGLGIVPLSEPFDRPNPMLVLVAGFVFLMGQRELQMVEWRARLKDEEPLEVLPVRRPQPDPEIVLAPRPAVTVYTWDAVNGVWVREAGQRPAPRFRGFDGLA
jgi:Zn-dependent protease